MCTQVGPVDVSLFGKAHDPVHSYGPCYVYTSLMSFLFLFFMNEKKQNTKLQ